MHSGSACALHRTKTEISYMSCLPTHDIFYMYLAAKQMKFVENLALSYKYPTCMYTKFTFFFFYLVSYVCGALNVVDCTLKAAYVAVLLSV